MKTPKFFIPLIVFLAFYSSCNDLSELPVELAISKSATPIIGENGEYLLEPQKFTRGTQDPTTFQVPLVVENFHCFTEPYYLNVINGDGNGVGAVTSAIISIDGKVIFSQSDFNKKVRDMMSSVSINENSVLTVELRGKPETNITVSIEGAYNPCRWEYTYDGSGSDVARSFIGTDDGGYIFTGYAYSNDGDVEMSKATWVVKLDKNGLIDWQTNFEVDWGDADIYQTLDHGYVLTGSGGTLKINERGNLVEWISNVPGNDVIQCSDMGYLILYNNYNEPSKITKLSPSGDFVWTKSYSGYKWFDLLEDELANGEFIVAGGTGVSDSKFAAMRIDSNGVIIWINNYTESHYYNSANVVLQDGINGFILTGGVDYRVVYLNYDGSLNWNRLFNPPNDNMGITKSICKTRNGFIIAGTMFNTKGTDTGFPNGVDIMAVEFDRDGLILKWQFVGGELEEDSAGIVLAEDGDIVLGGIMQKSYSPFDADYWATKINWN